MDKNLENEKFMSKAIGLAKVALSKGEVPIGAIVVSPDGNIIGRGSNRIEARGCHLEHAEARAVKSACKKVGGWRLDGCSLYVTLEPCVMCFGLIGLSRIKNIYFGAKSPIFGVGLTSDSAGQIYHNGLSISGGLKAKECADILKSFFRKAREKRRL